MMSESDTSAAKKRKVDDISDETKGAESFSSKPQPLLAHELKRVTLSMNPTYLDHLKEAQILGYEKSFSQRVAIPRYYELNLDNIRNAMATVLEQYMKWNMSSLVKVIVPLTVDACMTALYAKQHMIHKSYGRYSTRFNVPTTYTKDMELPLPHPFADAISNIGVFETQSMKKTYLVIPVYPEGTRHEGRASEEWNAYEYKAYIPMLRECGIPVKSVDTRVKLGNAWWTFMSEFTHKTFNLRCIFPFDHYPDHAVITALMFVQHDTAQNPLQIVKHLADDANYGYRFKELLVYEPFKAFAALCHGPSQEWNGYCNVT